MEQQGQIDPHDFHAKMQELKDLYIEVKEVIILAENFDPQHEVYLSPLNELRNSYDHIMRCMVYPGNVNNEFNEAKEHLYRAGYDAYEVLAINVSDAIVNIVERYKSNVVSAIFPAYYKEIRPVIVKLKIELAKERAHKRLNPETGTKSFTPYKEKVNILLEHLQFCEQNIPALEREKKNGFWTSRGKTVVAVIVGIVVTIIGLYLYDNFFKREVPTILTTPSKKNKQ